jgi:phosphate:Na+ symporter
MTVYHFLDLLGGLAIFLFGMTMMNNNLTALAGAKLKNIMVVLTKNKFRGYLTGLGVTILNQSSSATTVLEAVLVGAGLMTFNQCLAVTLGAELGSTFLGQLFAFPKITRLATLFVAIGFFSFLLAKNKRGKSLANTILGFGLLFLGMEMMSRSVEPLRSSAWFLDAMVKVENPFLGVLVGLLFTMIIQSSGATSGLVIAMAIAGTINLAQAVPINLGASIGTCITAILGSLNLNREAKRSAYVHVVFQTIGVMIAFTLLLIPFKGGSFYLFLAKQAAFLISGDADNLPRQIAMAHTLMPVINHMFVFPMLPLIMKVFNRVFPPAPAKEEFGAQYLDEGMLSEPSVALYQTKKEILRMVSIIETMMDNAIRIFRDRNLEVVKSIRNEDNMVDTLRKQIVVYLSKIAKQVLSEGESKLQISYLFIAAELENLGDVIERNVLDRAKKLINKDLHFSDEGLEDINTLGSLVVKNFGLVMNALKNDDPRGAREVLASAGNSWEFQNELRKKHFRRLNEGLQVSIETTEIHMDLLNHFHRINRHIYHLAQTLVELEEQNRS